MEIAEYELSLHIRELRSSGLTMRNPVEFVVRCNGKEAGSYRVELVSLRKILEVLQWDTIVVRYTYGESETMAERVLIDSTPCNYGGWRYWFRCPGCGRRCAVLYIIHYVRCRICHGLIFESQSLHELDRRAEQVRNRRLKLGGGPSLIAEFPPKPKHMRRKTYLRLFKADERESIQVAREIMAGMDMLMARVGISFGGPDDRKKAEEAALQALLFSARRDEDLIRALAEGYQSSQVPSNKPT